MGLSIKDRVKAMPLAEQRAFLADLPEELVDEIQRGEWWWTSRPEQVPPPGDWMIFLYLAGRGTGKSRSGSEWIVQRTIDHPVDTSGAPTERAVIGEGIADVRNVLFGGPSGIVRVLKRRGIPHRYVKSPKPQVTFLETGCIIHGDGADNEDVARGLNLADVWLDEVCKWPKPSASWAEGIMPALRIPVPGDHPRCFVTTTPKPIPLLREWFEETDGSVHKVSGSTYDNAANLSPKVLAEFRKRYEGTRIGQQEIHGVLLDDLSGVLFSQRDFDDHRVTEVPDDLRIVVGIDPGLTGEGDETGVVVVGADRANEWFVLADQSILGVGRQAAEHCWRVWSQYGATHLVVETNLGRKWMVETFSTVYDELLEAGELPPGSPPAGHAPIEEIDAKAGKGLRAQPVGMRSEQGHIHMVGYLPELEKQAVSYDPADKDSPDRLDAFVHACRYHLKQEKRRVSIASPVSLARKRGLGMIQREYDPFDYPNTHVS